VAKGILGRKVGMTQVFDDRGRQIPVTVVEAGPCVVVQAKTPERDGYAAVQLGFGTIRESRVNKPLRGHFARAGVAPRRVLREFHWSDGAPEPGQEVTVAIFGAGERVDVVGNIKRHHGRRGPMSHGSKYHRRVGSLNAATQPARVFKGRKMPGHMGDERVTVLSGEVVRVDAERNLLLLRGGVPGVRGAVLAIRDAVRPRRGASAGA
jgi:large subunit ribosomal protein L3